MGIGELKALGTVLAMVAFFAIVFWAYNPKNRARFEADAQLPLEGENLPVAKTEHATDQEERVGK